MASILGLFCQCFEDGSAGTVTSEQLSILHQGDVFVQSVYLGLSSKELIMKLSESNAVISWVSKDKPSDDFGEIDFATNVSRVKPTGQQGLQYMSKENKNIFEVSAKNTATRDQWIVALNEILSNWEGKCLSVSVQYEFYVVTHSCILGLYESNVTIWNIFLFVL